MPGDLGRDLGEHSGQALGLVVGGDADEHPAPSLAAGRLQLGGRKRADEATDPLIGPLRPTEREEDQQVGDRRREDQERDEPPERFALETEDVLDRADQVRGDGDGAEAKADEEQAHRWHSAPGSRAAQSNSATRTTTDGEGDPSQAKKADGHVRSV